MGREMLTPKMSLPLDYLSLRLLHGSFGPMNLHPHGISIGSVVLARLTYARDQQTDTDRPRYNGNNKPNLMLRIAMWPNNTATSTAFPANNGAIRDNVQQHAANKLISGMQPANLNQEAAITTANMLYGSHAST